jgi:Ca2+-binding RTX toxin-like protein
MIVTVANAAPNGSLAGMSSGVRGQTLSFTGSAADAGVNDALQVAWNFGDGMTIPFAPVSSGALAPSHVYANVGTYNVTMTLKDDAGATTFIARKVGVADVTLQQDPFDANKTALLVGGTTGNDTILITLASNGRLRATINGITSAKTFAPTGHVVVYAQGGANGIDVADKITLPAALFGGSGKDTLDGGGGNDILVARKGNDRLFGRAGRDLLFAGAGTDILDGGGDDDVLVPGTWSGEYDDGGLAAVSSEWSRLDRNYLQRVKALRGDLSDGFNGGYRVNATTVSDDGVADILAGGAARDWFLAATAGVNKDAITSESGEIVTTINEPAAFANLISTSATSGRLNSIGGRSPARSMSRTLVPLRWTFVSGPCGQVFWLTMPSQTLHQLLCSNFSGVMPTSFGMSNWSKIFCASYVP